MRKTNKIKKTALKSAALLCGSAMLAGKFLRWSNDCITINKITCHVPRLPAGFEGFKILLAADLHNKLFGKNQSGLIGLCEEQKPDIIAACGDFIDRRRPGIHAAAEFFKYSRRIAPVYFVSGNHEKDSHEFVRFKRYLDLYNIVDLDRDPSGVILQRGQDRLRLYGIKDRSREPEIVGPYASHDEFSVLLAHRPERIEFYSLAGADLVLSGHAHGGQFRLPFIGGLYSPDQGIFPKYTCGLYRYKDTLMAVSRGLGESAFPTRLFNRPELVVLTLTREFS